MKLVKYLAAATLLIQSCHKIVDSSLERGYCQQNPSVEPSYLCKTGINALDGYDACRVTDPTGNIILIGRLKDDYDPIAEAVKMRDCFNDKESLILAYDTNFDNKPEVVSSIIIGGSRLQRLPRETIDDCFAWLSSK